MAPDTSSLGFQDVQAEGLEGESCLVNHREGFAELAVDAAGYPQGDDRNPTEEVGSGRLATEPEHPIEDLEGRSQQQADMPEDGRLGAMAHCSDSACRLSAVRSEEAAAGL